MILASFRPIIFSIFILSFHLNLIEAAGEGPYRGCAISIRSAVGDVPLDSLGLEKIIRGWGDKALEAANGFDKLHDLLVKNEVESLPPEEQGKAMERAIALKRNLSRPWLLYVHAPEGTLSIEVVREGSEQSSHTIELKVSFYDTNRKLIWVNSGVFYYSEAFEESTGNRVGTFYGKFTDVDSNWMRQGGFIEARPKKGGAEAYPREVERIVVLKFFETEEAPGLGVNIVNLRRHILGDLWENGLNDSEFPKYLNDQMLIFRPPQKQNKKSDGKDKI